MFTELLIKMRFCVHFLCKKITFFGVFEANLHVIVPANIWMPAFFRRILASELEDFFAHKRFKDSDIEHEGVLAETDFAL